MLGTLVSMQIMNSLCCSPYYPLLKMTGLFMSIAFVTIYFSLCHSASLDLVVTSPPCCLITTSPHHPIILSPHCLTTSSPCHLTTLPPHHQVTPPSHPLCLVLVLASSSSLSHLRVLESLLSSFPLLYLHSLVRAHFLSSTYTLAHVT